MKTRIFILLMILMTGMQLNAQKVIGLSKDEVQALVKSSVKEFKLDKSITQQAFNYLKYVNDSQTKTWIIFFSEDDICTHTKTVCDYSEYDFVLDDLKKSCRNVADKTWEYKEDGKTFVITLEESDWYFTLREKLK
ncbi:MAG: hypothetical protein ACOYXB_15285 [Bacteroidota bacterium]